jgi:hypothetical protein
MPEQELAAFLPHLKLAIDMARLEVGSEGKVELGVLGVQPDGSGRIVARFETTFVTDLERLVTGNEAPVPEASEPCGITGCDKQAQPGDALCMEHRRVISLEHANGAGGKQAKAMEEIAQRLFTALGLAKRGGMNAQGQWKDDWAAKGAIRQALDDVFELATTPKEIET